MKARVRISVRVHLCQAGQTAQHRLGVLEADVAKLQQIYLQLQRTENTNYKKQIFTETTKISKCPLFLTSRPGSLRGGSAWRADSQ